MAAVRLCCDDACSCDAAGDAVHLDLHPVGHHRAYPQGVHPVLHQAHRRVRFQGLGGDHHGRGRPKVHHLGGDLRRFLDHSDGQLRGLRSPVYLLHPEAGHWGA